MEKLTRQQYKEDLSIKDLPDLIEDVVIRKARISDTPFARIRLNGDFSILIPENACNLFRRKNELIIEKFTEADVMRKIGIVREHRWVGDAMVDETQIIPNEHWIVEALALIENSRNNLESWKERRRWERYYLTGFGASEIKT